MAVWAPLLGARRPTSHLAWARAIRPRDRGQLGTGQGSPASPLAWPSAWDGSPRHGPAVQDRAGDAWASGLQLRRCPRLRPARPARSQAGSGRSAWYSQVSRQGVQVPRHRREPALRAVGRQHAIVLVAAAGGRAGGPRARLGGARRGTECDAEPEGAEPGCAGHRGGREGGGHRWRTVREEQASLRGLHSWVSRVGLGRGGRSQGTFSPLAPLPSFPPSWQEFHPGKKKANNPESGERVLQAFGLRAQDPVPERTASGPQGIGGGPRKHLVRSRSPTWRGEQPQKYNSGSPAASWLLGRGARGCLARWAVKGRSRGAGGGRVATGGDFQPSPRPPTREGVTSTHKASCTRPQSGGSPGALDPAPGMEPGARLGGRAHPA